MLEREEWMAHVASILRARDMHERPGRERDIRDRGTIGSRGRAGNHAREPNLTTTAQANQTFSICSSITHYGGGALIAAAASNSTHRRRHSPSGETIRIIRRSDKEGAERREEGRESSPPVGKRSDGGVDAAAFLK